MEPRIGDRHDRFKETNCPRSLFCLFFIMRHHNNRPSVFLIQPVKQFHNFRSHSGVQVTGRLVSKDNLRIADNRTGNSNTLALTTGELRREMTHPVT